MPKDFRRAGSCRLVCGHGRNSRTWTEKVTAVGRSRTDPEFVLARELVLHHGWNTTCYQLLNPGIEWWFSARRDALVGYVACQGRRIVGGAPVCELGRLAEVVEEFESSASAPVCYFGAEGRMLALTEGRQEYSTVVLGAQPSWDPTHWIQAQAADASIRAQFSRARNKGVSVNEWGADRAEANPELHQRLQEWLGTKGLPAMHFLVEPETLENMRDRRVFVAEARGRPIGFVVLSPVPVRNGWLTEQFVRGRGAPNGTVELMLDTAIRAVAEQGSRYVTMGIVPLSKRASPELEHNPVWLRVLAAWVRAHGRRFYNFDGLDWFKSKFHPDDWEPILAISREPRFSFRTLYAIAAAFSDGPPILAVLRGLGRAAGQEARWIGAKLSK